MTPFEGSQDGPRDFGVADILGETYESPVDLAASMGEPEIRNRIAALDAARLDTEAEIAQLQSRATRLQNQTLIAHEALRIASDKNLE